MSTKGMFEPGTYASIPKELLAEPNIRPAAKVVYLGIQTYLAGTKTQAWPGPADLRRRTGLSRRGIQKGVDKLVGTGWIRKQSSGGPKGTNLYTLLPQRTPCASAQEAPEAAHPVRGRGAPRAPKEPQQEHQKRTPRTHAADKPPCDSRVKTFLDWFSAEYEATLGRKYIVSGGKDGKLLKQVLARLDDDGSDPLAELQRAARNMLADPWGQPRASVGLLAAQLNTWRGGPAGAGKGRRSTFTPAPVARGYNELSRDFS